MTTLSRYPSGPGFVAGSDTSEAAAESIAGRRDTRKTRVLDYVTRCCVAGVTCSEVEWDLGMSHQSASARLRELVLDGKIADSGERRPGRSGRSQRVYQATS